MSGVPVAVVASGCVSALGFNARACWTAIRAKLSGLRTESLCDPYSGEPISIGRVPLPQWWEGVGKLADLLAPALLECLRAAEAAGLARAELAGVPLVLALPEVGRCHRPATLERELIAEIEQRLGPLHPDSSLISSGRSGGVLALDAAVARLRGGGVQCCIVAGVDSFLHLETVQSYVDRRRIVTPDNSNGFFPGEAGAAVLLAPGRGHPLGELHLLGLGVAHEQASIESDLPLRGDGLCAAIREALAPAGMTLLDVDYRLTDLNAERYKFKESTLAIAKLDRKVDALGREAPDDRTLELWHPIEYLGEVGAAIVPCLLGLALEAGRAGWAPGPVALCHVSDDDGQRAAVVVRSHPGRAPAAFLGRAIRER
ncbi:MAG: beta-ketoacyl synthase N-terminal-like domain-containing protein [Enhygromyxa sp.]